MHVGTQQLELERAGSAWTCVRQVVKTPSSVSTRSKLQLAIIECACIGTDMCRELKTQQLIATCALLCTPLCLVMCVYSVCEYMCVCVRVCVLCVCTMCVCVHCICKLICRIMCISNHTCLALWHCMINVESSKWMHGLYVIGKRVLL